MKIGRKTDKYEVAVVQPRMHNGHHKRTEAVTGEILIGGEAAVGLGQQSTVTRFFDHGWPRQKGSCLMKTPRSRTALTVSMDAPATEMGE